MAGHMAVEEPNSRVVRHHVSDDTHHGGEHHHVHAHMAYGGCLPVPVRSVNVPGLLLVRIGEQIPPDALSFVHGQHGAVAIQVAVDGEEVMEVVYACVVAVIIFGITVEPLEI